MTQSGSPAMHSGWLATEMQRLYPWRIDRLGELYRYAELRPNGRIPPEAGTGKVWIPTTRPQLMRLPNTRGQVESLMAEPQHELRVRTLAEHFVALANISLAPRSLARPGMVIEGVIAQVHVLAALLRARGPRWIETVVDNSTLMRLKLSIFKDMMKERQLTPDMETYLDAYYGLLSSFISSGNDLLMRAGVDRTHIELVQTRFQQEALLAEGVTAFNTLLLARERCSFVGDEASYYRMLKACLDSIGLLRARFGAFEELVPRQEYESLRGWMTEYERRNSVVASRR